MSFEVEQKFRTGSHEPVAARLRTLGASAGPAVELEDIYLSHPARDFARTNEALRLRRTGDRNAITYKGPKRAGPTKTREEIEIPFADGREGLTGMRAVFEALGFSPVAVIRKVRTPFHLTWDGHAVEVALDRSEGFGDFVEVETIARGEPDLPEAQRAILDLAAALGLSEVEPRSYLRMALERRDPAGGG